MNFKKSIVLIAVFCLVSLGGSAFAELCTIDAVPAATLLLPYFEVDRTATTSTSGLTTLFSVNNASAAPTVAHVTLWTDMSVPILDFDIFLTGYDVQTVNLWDVFVNGDIPETLHDAEDGFTGAPEDQISPHGLNPLWDSAPSNPANPLFTGCNAQLPIDNIGAILTNMIQQGHAGQDVDFFDGDCAGFPHGDGIERGYITIDNVTDCNLLFPDSPSYYSLNLLSNVNQLWGDYVLLDGANNFAHGDNLVHVEAGPVDAQGMPTFFAAGDYTFYGRYVGGAATDNREPLATTWAARYLTPNELATFNGGTDFYVWRDSKHAQATFDCDLPAPTADVPWYPLNETQIVAFSETEDAVDLCTATTGQVSPPQLGEPTCLPIETQRVTVGQPGATGDIIAPPYNFGWLYLNLNFTLATGGVSDNDGLFSNIAQSWVSTSLNASGLFSVGFDAIQLTSACDLVSPIIGGIIPTFTP